MNKRTKASRNQSNVKIHSTGVPYFIFIVYEIQISI